MQSTSRVGRTAATIAAALTVAVVAPVAASAAAHPAHRGHHAGHGPGHRAGHGPGTRHRHHWGHRPGHHGDRDGFRFERSFTVANTIAGEGVASYPDGRLLFRGVGEVPPAVAAMGYTHVGDEDIDADGNVYDDYENGNPNPTAKEYTVTAPDGQVSYYPHPLAAGEAFNNSFATVSPDERWMVSGEWNLESRLLLFANPKGLPSGTSINLAGQIDLQPALYHVQGCDFMTSRRLICDIDASATSHPLVEVDLSAPLHPGDNPATDHTLFVPVEQSSCPGPDFENEGIDYLHSSGDLTISMNQPGACSVFTSVDLYRSARWGRGR